ncbi:hypothetical protein [Roseovarius sp.]|uniref:hypothetical protein n=1 Tax=Roseovarius sp. TaxID=1486281 RepID=UPI0035659425
MKRRLLDNLKNIPGWHTTEKLVVFSVDDYGNVRLDSKTARDRMAAGGVELQGRFDHLDTLETRQDLEGLLETLSSVTDSRGRHAVFTPYALSANPDFEAMAQSDQGYQYEPLTRTFKRLAADQPAAYEGAWALWLEGIRAGLLKPQFHGREHLNVEVLERKLKAGDRALKLNIENRSMAGLGVEPSLPGVGFTHGFGLWERSETARHREIIADGLKLFEQVFGFPSISFTPPAQKLHPELYPFVESQGVRAIDKPLHCVRRLDRDRTVREFNALGRRRGQGHVSLVRNVVCEPTDDRSFDSVGLALGQVAAAFRWRKPAIISSHRVNFCGHIEEDNRAFGLNALRRLLQGIVQRWPDVQFISADELAERIETEV